MKPGNRVYFAYGSNLHPLRLRERVPSAQLLGAASLHGHVLAYGKRGIDGSGKCTTRPGARGTDRVLGALFSVRDDELHVLDAAEGPDYQRKTALFTLATRSIEAFYYEAREHALDDKLRPFDWYRDLVVAGARFHGLPTDYVAMLQAVVTQHDPDAQRVARVRELLASMSGD